MKRKICCFLMAFLFFCIPLNAQRKVVYVSGETIMIKAQYDGILISGEFDFEVNGQTITDHPDQSVQTGDLIVSVNRSDVHNCDDLNQIISKQKITVNSLDVEVKRNDTIQNARLYLYYDQDKNVFKTGFYIKDHISGIGTLTYIDPVNQSYAALGHEITEKTTSRPADVHMGTVAFGNVTKIEPSSINQPGEKTGRSTGKVLGNVLLNNEFGLYGKTVQSFQNEVMEIGYQHEIHPGKAYLLTVLDGSTIQKVEVEITKINRQTSMGTKGIELNLIDQEVLEKTGGIVQGMSGSPIIQNGRIVGALTHMIPSSPHKGYGIFIEWMIQNSSQL